MSRVIVKKLMFSLIMYMSAFHSSAIVADGEFSAPRNVYSTYLEFLDAVNRSASNSQLKRYFSKSQNSYFNLLPEKMVVKGRSGREMDYDVRELLVRLARLKNVIDYKTKQYSNYVCLIVTGSDGSGQAVNVVIRYVKEDNQNKIDYVGIDTANKASAVDNTERLCAYVEPGPFFD